MKALTYMNYGKPSSIFKLKEVDNPLPKENEILVKVHATTVNRTDEGLVTARYFVSRLFTGIFRPKRQVPGTDFAGEVIKKGSNVITFKVGDKVFGFNDEILSSHAEYLSIDEGAGIVQIPNGLSYESAAASCEGAHYALNFINKVKLLKGQKVLVNGATGAIGSAAVQLLRNEGLEVTATANTRNITLVESLGATRVIDYTKEDFTKVSDTYDFIFDTVGKSTFLKCKPLLKPKGVYISSELGAYGSNLWLSLTTPLMGGKRVKFPVPRKIKQSLELIKRLITEGKFTAVIDRTYSFEAIIEAYDYVASGQKTGNVVIKITSEEDMA
ncbi:NADPH:quinone reductase-like Zn-dependent oxidoreductase [Flavobacteriaceae bacterium MAR_2009_75]|nr:NADPH:quinone reductase-like Zn-dependent oxidoreductase [Flavobacteriaceae bacterium MAR_2009_75]